MHFNIYDVFNSQCSQQHVSAVIVAIIRVMLLLQEYKRTTLVNRVAASHSVKIKIIISVKIM